MLDFILDRALEVWAAILHSWCLDRVGLCELQAAADEFDMSWIGRITEHVLAELHSPVKDTHLTDAPITPAHSPPELEFKASASMPSTQSRFFLVPKMVKSSPCTTAMSPLSE